MQDTDVAGWVRSLQLRGIALPDNIKDEVFLIIGERRLTQMCIRDSTDTPFTVESDWSAASYWYQMMAIEGIKNEKIKGGDRSRDVYKRQVRNGG